MKWLNSLYNLPSDEESQRINDELLRMIPKNEVEKVLGQEMCDINPSFLGFVDVYYYLSRLIPKDWTVFDFGCAYNPQSYFFKEHSHYIAVDSDVHEVFQPDNCTVYFMTAQDFMRSILPLTDYRIDKAFAIVNYVPDFEVAELARSIFKNCYTFYPSLL